MADLRKRFGQLLAAHRRRHGLTQERLAEAAKLSVDMVAKIETGATGARFPVIERLAGALEIDPAELFTTEIPGGAIKRGAFAEISSRLARLPEADLVWVRNLLDAALAQSGVDRSTVKATASTTRKIGASSQASRVSKAKSR
jgi:transcriptional regulator with XRE-family HTH domain